MPLFDAICNDPVLCSLIRQTCEEHGALVKIAEELLQDESLDSSQILILKPDAYYNSANMHNPPPSIDCMVFVRCPSGFYDIYMIELRDTKDKNRISAKTIQPKFKTIAENFVVTFADIFRLLENRVNEVHMWVVTGKYKTSLNDIELEKKNPFRSVVEQYALLRPLTVFNKTVSIKPFVPYTGKPGPTIVPCRHMG